MLGALMAKRLIGEKLGQRLHSQALAFVIFPVRPDRNEHSAPTTSQEEPSQAAPGQELPFMPNDRQCGCRESNSKAMTSNKEKLPIAEEIYPDQSFISLMEKT